MRCSSCGRENRSDAVFCDRCGTALGGDCARCGHRLQSGARFCDACGHPVGDVPRVVERTSIAEGERRTVSVLFVDMVGSTAIGERLDAEDVYALVQRGHARMQEAVYRYEGAVTQFRGDGIMALFGAPVAQEDAARSAVAAALDMQRSLRALASEVAARYGVSPEYRVGINTGPVVVGRIGDELAMEFTAIGDTVNVAARLEAEAPPGEVLVSEATWERVQAYFDGDALEPLALKGKHDELRAWRVRRPTTLRTRFEAAASHGLSPFVGRRHELRLLESLVDEARDGRGQVAVVSGEAGLGKTRLFVELHRRLGDGVRWVEGQCVSYGQQIPYLPVVDLVKSACGVRENDDEPAVLDKVSSPYLRSLLAVAPGDDAVRDMDPRERRGRVMDALRALIRRVSDDAPAVVLVEDLHWIDEHSETAVAAVADVVTDLPVLLVLTHRPGYESSLADRASFHRIALHPLAQDEPGSLACGVLGVPSVPADVEELIRRKTEGNPLFVEEVVKSLVETGGLQRRNGSVVIGPAADDVPGTLQEVILARVDRLPDDAKRSLQLASVIGREFTVRLLERVSDPARHLDDALGELKSLDLIYEKEWFPELAYMFKHALTHEVTLSTLLVERRRRLHKFVARAIEDLYADRVAEHYETLAHHYSEAQDWDKALEYLALASRKSAEALAARESLDYGRRAVDAWERVGTAPLEVAGELLYACALGSVVFAQDIEGGRADTARLVRLARLRDDRDWHAIALVLDALMDFYLHEFDDTLAKLASAAALVGRGSAALPHIHFAWGFAEAILGELAVARDHLAAAEATVRVDTPSWLRAFLGWLPGGLGHWAGRFDEALARVEKAETLAIDDAAGRLLARGLLPWQRALSELARGDYETGLRRLNDALDFCERTGEWMMRIRALNTIGWVYGELYQPETALDWNERSLRDADEVGLPDPEVQCNALLNMADNYLELGRLADAEHALQRVERVVRDPAPRERWMLWRYAQHYFHTAGELRLARGDAAGALALAEECVDLARRTDSAKNVAKGLRLRGQVLAAAGGDGAEAELRAALAVADGVGNPRQIWLTHVALGQLAGAPQHFRDAARVIRSVAGVLSDDDLRTGFLTSPAVTSIMSRAQ